MRKMRPFQMFVLQYLTTLGIRKSTHTATCYFRCLIFLTTELQLAVFELPSAVPEKMNRYKAFMSSNPVRVRFNANHGTEL